MSKLDLIQYTLVILAIVSLLFISWKWAVLLLAIDGIIGIARYARRANV